MNAMTKQILTNIKYKANMTPTMIEAVDRVFILDHVSKYSVSGFVCGTIGNYLFKVQTGQNSENQKRSTLHHG